MLVTSRRDQISNRAAGEFSLISARLGMVAGKGAACICLTQRREGDLPTRAAGYKVVEVQYSRPSACSDEDALLLLLLLLLLQERVGMPG